MPFLFSRNKNVQNVFPKRPNEAILCLQSSPGRHVASFYWLMNSDSQWIVILPNSIMITINKYTELIIKRYQKGFSSHCSRELSKGVPCFFYRKHNGFPVGVSLCLKTGKPKSGEAEKQRRREKGKKSETHKSKQASKQESAKLWKRFEKRFCIINQLLYNALETPDEESLKFCISEKVGPGTIGCHYNC